MNKGSISLEDARLVHEFALHVQPMLRSHDCSKLLEAAQTCVRIAYCALTEARQNARAERMRMIPPEGFIQDPYTTRVTSE